MFNKKKFFNQAGEVGLVLVLVLSLIAGTIFVVKKKMSKPVAKQGVPVLFYSIEPQTVAANQDFNLILKVNPNGADFHAFELYTKFDPIKIGFKDEVNLSTNIVSSHPLIISTIDTVNKTVSVVGTRTGVAFSGNEPIEIARIKMKKVNNNDRMVFTWDEKTKLGNKLEINKTDGIF